MKIEGKDRLIDVRHMDIGSVFVLTDGAVCMRVTAPIIDGRRVPVVNLATGEVAQIEDEDPVTPLPNACLLLRGERSKESQG